MSFRIEEKLLVRSGQLARLHDWLASENAILLHPRRRIFSTYFDTPDFDIYNASEEGSVPRKKIRVRTYNATGHFETDNTLEIKISSVEGRFKTTEKLSPDDVETVLSDGYFDPSYGLCRPVVSVSYDREYFKVGDVRLTIDTDIEYTACGSHFPVRDGSIAVEVKAPFGTSVDMLNVLIPHRRTRFSKYARAIGAVHKGSGAWL